MALFESDRAFARNSRMWLKLGGLFERAAYAHVEKNNPHSAMQCARMAEVCFWQATGEMDCVAMKDVVPKEPSDDR
jgi:hypothetical protein